MFDKRQAQKVERTRLLILQLLDEASQISDRGASHAEIERELRGKLGDDKFESIANVGLQLKAMEQAGLVIQTKEPVPILDRGSRNGGGTCKPYSITEEGRRNLEVAIQNAISTEPGQRSSWVESVSFSNLEQLARDFIRPLPEFNLSSEDRIQEVSRELAKRLFQAQFSSSKQK